MTNKLHSEVLAYLDASGCVYINPIWDGSHDQYHVGYHYKYGGSPISVRKELSRLFKKHELNYSMGEYDIMNNRNDLFIYMNNYEEVK